LEEAVKTIIEVMATFGIASFVGFTILIITAFIPPRKK